MGYQEVIYRSPLKVIEISIWTDVKSITLDNFYIITYINETWFFSICLIISYFKMWPSPLPLCNAIIVFKMYLKVYNTSMMKIYLYLKGNSQMNFFFCVLTEFIFTFRLYILYSVTRIIDWLLDTLKSVYGTLHLEIFYAVMDVYLNTSCFIVY